MIRKIPNVIFKTRVRDDFGDRFWRYATLIENRLIKKMWIEEGISDNSTNDNNGISSPENLIKELKNINRGLNESN